MNLYLDDDDNESVNETEDVALPSSRLFLLDIKNNNDGVAKIEQIIEVGNTDPAPLYKGWD